MVEAAIGRFGPYVKHGATYANLPDVEDVFVIGMNRAVEVLAQKAAGRGRGAAAPAAPLRALGAHPDGGDISVMPGRYGPYIKWGSVNATLPKETSPETVTLDEALALIAEKAAKSPKKGARAKPAAKPAAKAAAKAAGAKKTPAKKAAAKSGADDATPPKPAAKKAALKKAAPKKTAAKKDAP